MALVLSKMFMRTISQNPNENQTGISLWTLDDVHAAQEKQRAAAAVPTVLPTTKDVDDAMDLDMDMDDDDENEYGMSAIPDEVMATIDIGSANASITVT